MKDRQEFRKPTPDDWAPTHEDGTVRVLLIVDDGPHQFLNRILVKGEDDFGLEFDFETEGAARIAFKAISNWGIITQESLKALGYKAV